MHYSSLTRIGKLLTREFFDVLLYFFKSRNNIFVFMYGLCIFRRIMFKIFSKIHPIFPQNFSKDTPKFSHVYRITFKFLCIQGVPGGVSTIQNLDSTYYPK